MGGEVVMRAAGKGEAESAVSVVRQTVVKQKVTHVIILSFVSLCHAGMSRAK